MKRVIILALVTVLAILAFSGCNDESKPHFTRMNVVPACGVAPLRVEGYAIASGGDESGSPTGGNNNLEIKWDFAGEATSTTSIAFHNFENPGTYNVIVTGTDDSGNVTSTSQLVNVLPDTLKIIASIMDHPGFTVTTEDTFQLDLWASSCQVDPEVLEDYRKLDFEWIIHDELETFTFYTQNPIWTFSQPGTYDIFNRVTLSSLAVTRWDHMVVTVTAP